MQRKLRDQSKLKKVNRTFIAIPNNVKEDAYNLWCCECGHLRHIDDFSPAQFENKSMSTRYCMNHRYGAPMATSTKQQTQWCYKCRVVKNIEDFPDAILNNEPAGKLGYETPKMCTACHKRFCIVVPKSSSINVLEEKGDVFEEEILDEKVEMDSKASSDEEESVLSDTDEDEEEKPKKKKRIVKRFVVESSDEEEEEEKPRRRIRRKDDDVKFSKKRKRVVISDDEEDEEEEIEPTLMVFKNEPPKYTLKHLMLCCVCKGMKPSSEYAEIELNRVPNTCNKCLEAQQQVTSVVEGALDALVAHVEQSTPDAPVVEEEEKEEIAIEDATMQEVPKDVISLSLIGRIRAEIKKQQVDELRKQIREEIQLIQLSQQEIQKIVKEEMDKL